MKRKCFHFEARGRGKRERGDEGGQKYGAEQQGEGGRVMEG